MLPLLWWIKILKSDPTRHSAWVVGAIWGPSASHPISTIWHASLSCAEEQEASNAGIAILNLFFSNPEKEIT